MASRILVIALAGAAGTLTRYWLSGLVQRLCGTDFPWGTWAVNTVGCMLFGLVWVLSEERFLLSNQVRFFILVGFMGAFTTFSTYIFESYAMVGDGAWLRFAFNMAGQNLAGFAAFYLGAVLGRII